jgi:hypothetical protein
MSPLALLPGGDQLVEGVEETVVLVLRTLDIVEEVREMEGHGLRRSWRLLVFC